MISLDRSKRCREDVESMMRALLMAHFRLQAGVRSCVRRRRLRIHGATVACISSRAALVGSGSFSRARFPDAQRMSRSFLLAAVACPGRCIRNSAFAARVEDVALDVSDATAVKTLIADIRARYGRLDGVLHAAGVLDDGAVAAKTLESFRAVLAPKVAGTCHLDRAIGAEPLDLFLLFASLSGAVGNPGQADYAAANAFLDVFAAEREARRSAGLCHGRTLAVDWPVWREGGMRPFGQTRKS